MRAYAALDRILQSKAEHQIVVVHGGTATFLLAAWIGMPIGPRERCHGMASASVGARREARIAG